MNVHLTAKQIEMHDYHGHDPVDDDVEPEPMSSLAVVEPEPISHSPCDDDDNDEDLEDGIIPHGEVGASAAELARNLPDLVEHLRRLRLEMEKCNKIYEAINLTQRASGKLSPNDDDLVDSFATNEFDSFGNHGPPALARAASAASAVSVANRRSMMQMQPQAMRSSLRVSTTLQQSVSYSVMWVSGECGISLRNFSSSKIGAQIAVLQQADGVTTGISNCRLGDQLMFVNDDRVDDMRFKDIVQKLKSTRRPISLGFHANQNIQTSPTAASSSANRSTVASLNRASSTKGFFGASNDMVDDQMHQAITDLGLNRQTSSSMRSSSTSTLSDDVEIFCKEQEEMHSDIIVLLTETVLRCEKLQQQNMDQLQSLMQLAPNVQSTSSSPSSSQEAVLAMSSLAPVESPAVAVKMRESMLDQAARSSHGSATSSFHSATKWTPTTATSA